MNRVVIGVDPASGKKGSYVFAPELPAEFHDRYLQPQQIGELVLHARERNAIVCWDAPLTGPPVDRFESSEKWKTSSFLTQRPIERVGLWKGSVDRKLSPFSEDGVSLLGYAGLSHWTITQAALGLPVVPSVVPGLTNTSKPALTLATSRPVRAEGAVVEVHPTVAGWLWLSTDGYWRQYKGRIKRSRINAEQAKDAVAAMWERLCAMAGLDYCSWPNEPALANSSYADAFDARVAWLLGSLWIGTLSADELEPVEYVGHAETGGFLLPTDRLEPSKLLDRCRVEQGRRS